MRESIDIIIRQRGARTVRRDIDSIGRSSRRANDSIELMKRGLQALGGFYAVRELGRAIDQYNALNNRLSVVSGSLDNVRSSYDELLKISNRTLVPLQETTVLFQRASITADQLGASNRDLYQFVETVGQALAIQGGSAQTARGALLQLSQAIGTDIVRAEEFNSILEGAFPIALAAARGIDEASGSISRLRKMVIDGEITSREFFDAIMSQQDELAAQFAKITPTMAQGFNVLSNGWVTYIGRVDEALGVSHAIGQTMIWMGENMHVVGSTAISTAAALTTAFGPSMLRHVRNMTAGVMTFNAVLLANPVLALATAVVGLTTYLALMNDEIMLGTDNVQTLGDLMDVFVDDIQKVATAVWTYFTDLFGPAIESIGEFVEEYDLSVVGVLRGAADFADNFIGVYVGAFQAIKTIWERLPEVLINAMKSAIQPAADLFEEFVNKIITGMNNLRAHVGMDALELVDFDLALRGNGKDFGDLGESIGEAFMEGFEGQTNIRDYLENAIDLSTGKTLRRQYEELMQIGDDPDLRPPPLLPPDFKDAPEAINKAGKALDDYAKDLENLRKQLDPAYAASQKLAESTALLDHGLSTGMLTLDQYLDLWDRAAETYIDATRETVELGDTTADTAQEMSREWERFGNSVDETFKDAFKGAFDSFEDFADQLKNAFENLLAELAYAAVKNEIKIQLGMQASGPMQGGISDIFGGGGLGGIGSNTLISKGADFLGLTSSLGVAGSAPISYATGFGAQVATGTYTGALGNATAAASTSTSGVLSTLSSAAPWIAGGLAIDNILGLGIVEGITDFVSDLFGGGKSEPSLHMRTVAPQDDYRGVFENTNHEVWGDSPFGTVGFWDPGTSRLNDLFGGDFDKARQMTEAIAAQDQMLAALADSEEQLAAMTEAAREFEHWGGDAQSILDGLGDRTVAIVSAIDDEWAAFAGGLEGDNQAVMERIQQAATTIELMSTAAERLNLNLGETGELSLTAADSLAQMAGGVQNLASVQQAYYQAVFSESERLSHQQSDLAAAMMGVTDTVPTTVDELRAMVEAADLNTEAGRELALQLMQLAPAFAQTTEAVEQAISGQYQAVLDRAADADGLAYWSQQVMSGALTLEQALASIANSTEAATSAVERAITDAYQSSLGRAPEASGLNYWVSEVMSGSLSLEEALEAIANSTEAAAGALDNFNVEEIFRGVSDDLDKFRQTLIVDQLEGPEEQYNYFKEQAEGMARLVGQLTDPDAIANAANQATQFATRAYGALDDSQQGEMGSDFLDFVSGLEDNTRESLEDAERRSAEITAEAVGKAVKQEMGRIADAIIESLADSDEKDKAVIDAIQTAMSRSGNRYRPSYSNEVNA